MAKGKKISTDVDASVKPASNGSKKAVKNESTPKKSKGFWNDDTAKAIAAVIAFLLIPTAIIAWIFASNQDDNLNSRDVTIEISKKEFTINPESSTILTEGTVEDESTLPQLQGGLTEKTSQVEQNQPTSEEVKPTSETPVPEEAIVESEDSSNKVKLFLLGLVSKLKDSFSGFNQSTDVATQEPTQDQANAEQNAEESTEPSDEQPVDQNSEVVEQNVDQTVQNDQSTNVEDKMDLEVKTDLSMLDTIKKLPDTNGDQDYIVQEGDSIYSISVKICGNQSFYVNNLKKDYLKVGSTIKVVCE